MTNILNTATRYLCAIPLGLALIASTQVEAKELRLGLITPPQHILNQTAQRLADTVAERSNGDLTITIFPSGQLGDESAMFTQMETGLLDIGLMTAAATSQREPAFVGWFTPFLFSSVEEAAKATETDAAQQMLQNLESKGLHAFGYTFAGMRHILMRESAVNSTEDVSGKNIRIIPFAAMNTWWRAVEARPTPTSLPDVYQGLQNGMLDGVDIDLGALVGSGFYEVAEHLTLTSHMAFPEVAIMGQASRASLSDAERQLIDTAMAEALAWGTKTEIAAEASNRTLLEDRINVYTLESAEDAFSTANQAFAERFGDHPLIQAFQQQSTELLNAE